MKKKLNVVLFWLYNDWGSYGRTYEQIAVNLAKLPEIGRVICVMPPKAQATEKEPISLNIRQINPVLTIVEEAALSRPRRSRIFAYAQFLLKSLCADIIFKLYLRRQGLRQGNTILWLFPPHPYIHRLLALVPRIGVVTQVVDDFTKFDPDHWLYKYAQAQYPEVGKWSDAIFTTSMANRDKFAATGKPCYLFYPAVDESFLGKPSRLPHKTTHESPRIGYLGFIMDRTDLELVEFVAKQRPQWQILLAGPEYPEGYLTKSNLMLLPNIQHLGAILPQHAPAFLHSLDVCLMPHRDNEYSRSMGPLKLYQYLASGRPIVSTNIAGLELVQDYISIANTQKEFLSFIESALDADTPELSLQRIKLATQNTWPVRIGEMVSAIKQQFPRSFV